MQITNVSKLNLQNKGCIEVIVTTSNSLGISEGDFIFAQQREAAQFVFSCFPDHFQNLETRSLPTPEPSEDEAGAVSITVLVDVTEKYEGALQDVADNQGLELCHI